MLYLASCPCNGNEKRLGRVLAGLCANRWNAFDDVWVIESELPATVLRDEIRRALGEEVPVIVTLLAGHAAWHGFDDDATDWLMRHL